jgi:hypothetical protein
VNGSATASRKDWGGCEMKRELEIIMVENGFVVFEGSSIQGAHGFSRMKWVAKTPKELAELVEKLVSKPDLQTSEG